MSKMCKSDNRYRVDVLSMDDDNIKVIVVDRRWCDGYEEGVNMFSLYGTQSNYLCVQENIYKLLGSGADGVRVAIQLIIGRIMEILYHEREQLPHHEDFAVYFKALEQIADVDTKLYWYYRSKIVKE